jgi:Ca2+-binding RTX toxin-like protein
VSSATVNLTVNPINDNPVAFDDNYSIEQNTTLFIDPVDGVLANDEDIDGDILTAELIGAPDNGTIQFNQDGSFSYSPNDGFSGTDSFTYQANDRIDNSNQATVTITVGITTNEINGTSSMDMLNGTTGNDIIIGKEGADFITGNGGDDVFVYRSLADGGDFITDWNLGDRFDFTELLNSFGYSGSNPIAESIISFMDLGMGIFIQIDPDGSEPFGVPSPYIFVQNASEVALNNNDNFVF